MAPMTEALTQPEAAKLPDSVPPEQVRSALEKILASPIFIRSRRLGRFLRFTIEQALQGRQATLKEYLVGVEVFNKLESFDPRIDSIVRVEARRLRSKLDLYYQTEGSNDPVVIQFVKGNYVPIMVRRDQLPLTKLAGFQGADTKKSLLIRNFQNLSGQNADEYFCSGLAQDIISAATKLGCYQVMARTEGDSNSSEVRPEYLLEGTVRRHGDRLRITTQLIHCEKSMYVWSDSFDRDTSDMLQVQDEIAQRIASALSRC